MGRQPGVEVLKRWMKRSRTLDRACSDDLRIEVVDELEEVAEGIGAGDA